jgi:hypothetical protein
MSGEFTDSLVKSSSTDLARYFGASEKNADRIGAVADLATGLVGGFVDDAIRSGGKYAAAAGANYADDIAKAAAKSAAWRLGAKHAGARLVVQSGGAIAGAAIGGFSSGDGSFNVDAALLGAGYGSAVGGLVGSFAVACFTAGTPLVVDKEGNSRPIDEIEVGDFVLARSEFDPVGPLELKRVEEKFVRTAVVMELLVNGQSIKTTAEHPFFVPAHGKFVAAGDLQVGEQLVGHDGKLVEIESIVSTDEVTTVYNLRVADFHTYFVGGGLWGWDVWVHNADYRLNSLSLKQKIQYLSDQGVAGADELLAKLNSSAKNVRQGALFQAKRAVNYYLAGKLDSIEHGVNGGNVDLFLKTGMQVENKSWWKWNELGRSLQSKRLDAIEAQVGRYLSTPGTRLRVEFNTQIFGDVEALLKHLRATTYGSRLSWKVI